MTNLINSSLQKSINDTFLQLLEDLKDKKEIDQIARQGFGKTPDYVASIKNATLEKMTKLIKLVGMLLQTKVYLFWSSY